MRKKMDSQADRWTRNKYVWSLMRSLIFIRSLKYVVRQMNERNEQQQPQ